jgi:hypothetical protein
MSAPRGWRQHAVVVVMLSALVAAAYGNSLQGGFPFDNRFQILEDVRLQAVTVDNVRRLFTEDLWWPRAVGGLYRPIKGHVRPTTPHSGTATGRSATTL